jgi:hypothetical protein
MLYNINMWMGASVEEAKVAICQNKNGIWHSFAEMVEKQQTPLPESESEVH